MDIKYNSTLGAFVNSATDDVVSQGNLKLWAATHPEPVKVGTVKPAIIKKVLSKIPGPIGVGAMAYGVKNMIDEGASVGEALSMPLMLNSRVRGMEVGLTGSKWRVAEYMCVFAWSDRLGRRQCRRSQEDHEQR